MTPTIPDAPSQPEVHPATTVEAPESWVRTLLFPAEPRTLPGKTWLLLILRTAHLAGFGILLGGHFFDVFHERMFLPLVVTVLSGVLLVALRVYESFFWVIQVRGLLTLAKIALLFQVTVDWERRLPILLGVLVLGSFSSHLPPHVRCYRLFQPATAARDTDCE